MDISDDFEEPIVPPWLPQLALTVREITSVSATFILASESGLSEFSFDDDDSADDRVISDALAKGLSVHVNGAPWQRVLMRVDEHADEAIIIIYGLMPGRQYDIELGLIGDDNVRGQITTEPQSDAHAQSPERATDTPSPSSLQPSSSSAPASPPTPTPTAEERVAHLQQTRADLDAERQALTHDLKAARRDAQKADAALRAEIEALKRASEKQAAAEHRARQKMRALQEAAKQAAGATADTAARAADVERALPALRAQRDAKERECAGAKERAERARLEREKADKCARRRADGMRAELAALGHKLEKLHGKKERLEGEVVAALEEQLAGLQAEAENVERDPFYGVEVEGEPDAPAFARRHPRYQAPFQRPSVAASRPGPIQRPSPGSSPSATQASPAVRPPAPIARPAAARPPAPAHGIQNRARALSASSSVAPSASSSSGGYPHIPASTSLPLQTPTASQTLPASASASTSTSTLSSRAQPFEPSGRLVGFGLGTMKTATSELNPSSVPFEPRSILTNPNKGRGAGKWEKAAAHPSV